ncbi:MAG: glutamate-5-semialdehyde dehydrogenase, partial [Ruminococcaceae bacterium]|nr:glutamate-5-semialdehyde dehydrogenase [Oscillospiraceae bacterium]
MTDVKERGDAALRAKEALALASTELKNSALLAMAKAINDNCAFILSENAKDLEYGKQNGLSTGLLDSLMLSEERIKGICDSIKEIADFDDPVGVTLSKVNREGMSIEKISVPMGVIGVICEARPNVAVDSAALCIKSGNAVILRGGKEAINSNIALTDTIRAAIESAGLPRDSVNLIHDVTRDSATELMRATEYLDLLIPRGGRGLIDAAVKNASVPVIETGAGVCHTYVDKAANLEMAAKVIYNAKVSRPSVCNSLECILVNKEIANKALPLIKSELDKAGVEIRGDEKTCAILHGIRQATNDDWGTEYNDLILAVKVVDGIDEAVSHISRYGTKHSEAIITEDSAAAESFLNRVDAAAVYLNASTRFTDGGVFGLGAEIGISTQKLHARGPLG